MQIEDLNDRLTFQKSLNEAILLNNDEKIKNIFCVISKYFNEKEERYTSEIYYDEPPSFYTAGLDFLHLISPDLINLPNLPEYFASVEMDAFPESTNWKKSNLKNQNKNKQKINTMVKKDMCLCSADTQSGKTIFSICLAVKCMLEGRTPVFTTRNITGDLNKLKNDIDNFSKKFDDFMEKHSVKDIKFKITCVNGDNLEEIEKKPRIVVCLGNNTQLSNIAKIFKNRPSTFDIIIDEIDFVDYGKNSNVSNVLSELKKISYQTFGVTATPLDTILSEHDIKSINIINLKRPADYRGFIDFQVKLLKIHPETTALNIKSTFDKILESDKNLKPFLEDFAKSKPDFIWSTKEYIPNICLIKNSNINDNQDEMFNGICNNFQSKVVTIVYNGEGICLNYKDIPSSFEINGTKVKPKTYSKIDIPDILQYLKDNGGVKKFPRIIIIAGILAGRCISYVSRDYCWHLTDMYYNPAKTTPIPEIIQSCGRLCGRNKGKAHLYLHCTERVASSLYDGFHFTNEIIMRAIASPLIENDEELSFDNSIKSVKMNNKKFPLGRRITSKVEIKKNEFNLVKGLDGGININEYKFVEIVEQEPQEEIQENNKEIGEEEFIRLTTKMFPVWKNATSKIANFMKNLDSNKLYSKKEIVDLCDNVGIVRLGQLKNIKSGTQGFGTIIQEINNKYRLYPCLVVEFNKNF